MALSFRSRSSNPFKVFPLRSVPGVFGTASVDLVLAQIQHPSPPHRLYNVVDDHQPSRRDQMVDVCIEDSLEKTDGFRLFSPRNMEAKTIDLIRP